MTDNKNQELIDSTKREMAEFGNMIGILKRKHAAIARLDTAEIQNIVSEEFDELNRIGLAEKERVTVLKSLSLSGNDLNDAGRLEAKLGHEDSQLFRRIQADFRRIFAQVVQLNNMTNILLVHSIEFIKQNIRILTDNGNRKLVDKRA